MYMGVCVCVLVGGVGAGGCSHWAIPPVKNEQITDWQDMLTIAGAEKRMV